MKPNKIPPAQAQRTEYKETDEHLKMRKGGKVKKPKVAILIAVCKKGKKP